MTLQIILIVLATIILHEGAHALTAYKLGDRTALEAGRLTLNPLRHVTLWGTLIVPGVLLLATGGKVLFGWLKPLPVNPERFTHVTPLDGMAIVSMAGPAANIVVMAICGIAFLIFNTEALRQAFTVNLLFGVVNFLPIKPLDGWHVARYKKSISEVSA